MFGAHVFGGGYYGQGPPGVVPAVVYEPSVLELSASFDDVVALTASSEDTVTFTASFVPTEHLTGSVE